MNKEAFVYCWTDHLRNMLYVGYHKGSIDDGYICSSKIMKEHYKERSNDFTRSIIAFGSVEDMIKFERTLLKTINAKKDNDFYNRSNGGKLYHIKEHTEDTKRKMSDAAKGKRKSDSAKQKMSEAKKGKPSGGKGRKHSDEAKQKMSEAKLGKVSAKKGIKTRPRTDEEKSHLSKINKGKTLSDEHKKKISLGRLEFHKNLNKEDNPYIGKKISEEQKQMLRKPKEKVQCPNCSKVGGKAIMLRWHFDNCKHKIDEAA